MSFKRVSPSSSPILRLVVVTTACLCALISPLPETWATEAPILLSPPRETTVMTSEGVTLEWAPVAGAVDYDVWLGPGRTAFAGDHIIDNVGYCPALAPADIDGDGDIDFYASIANAKATVWYENRGGDPVDFTSHTIRVASGAPGDIFATDMDGDGEVDDALCREGRAIMWHEYMEDGPTSFTTRIINRDISGVKSIYPSDLEGDGDVDVVVGCSHALSYTEYRISFWVCLNDGASPPQFQSTRVDYYSRSDDLSVRVSTGDFDNDGDMDLITFFPEMGVIRTYRNDGGVVPDFTPRSYLSGNGWMSSLRTYDLDHDGNLDFLLAHDDGVTWYRGTGTVWFEQTPILSGAGAAYSVIPADLDGDRYTDILTVSGDAQPLAFRWLVSDGADDPAFTTRQFEHVDHDFLPSVIADMDGDADIDILWADNSKIGWWELDHAPDPDAYELYLENTIATSCPITTHLDHGTTNYWSVVADNGEGEAESERWPFYTYDARGSASLDPGLDNFDLATTQSIAIHGTALDVDGDLSDFSWLLDFRAENDANWSMVTSGTGEVDDDVLTVWNYGFTLGTGDCQLRLRVVNQWGTATATRYPVNSLPPPDPPINVSPPLEAEGLPIQGVALDWEAGARTASFDAQFAEAKAGLVNEAIQITSGGNVYASEAADMDRDGDLDIVLNDDYEIVILENLGGLRPGFRRHDITDGQRLRRPLRAVDIDDDGDLDIFGAPTLGRPFSWLEATDAGAFEFTSHTIDQSSSDYMYDIDPGDLDGDGDLDLVTARHYNHEIHWYEQIDDGGDVRFVEHLIEDDAQGAYSSRMADIDGDGHLDVVVTADEDDTLAWYRNSGTPRPFFTAHEISNTLQAPRAARVADADGDGDVDVFCISDYETLQWFENSPGDATTFTAHLIHLSNDRIYNMDLCDIDDDGDVDIAVSQNLDGVLWFENDGQTPPTFERRGPLGDRRLSDTPVVADINGDGRKDILAAYHEAYLILHGGVPVGDWETIGTGLNDDPFPIPGTLDYETQYVWRAMARNGAGVTTGSSWSFTTRVAPPNAPTDPSPPDGAVGVSPDATLNWVTDWRDESQNLYLWKSGESRPGQPTTSGLAIDRYAPPASLDASTAYSWQVVLANGTGATSGPVWSFTTAASGGPQWMAEIASPLDGYDLASAPSVLITGTATDGDGNLSDFEWRLKYKGEDDDAWRHITSGTSEVDNGVLGVWTHDYTVTSGAITLRLSVASAAGDLIATRELVNYLAPPDTPLPLFPLDGATNVPAGDNHLQWLASARAFDYDVGFSGSVRSFAPRADISTATLENVARVLGVGDIDSDGAEEILAVLDDRFAIIDHTGDPMETFAITDLGPLDEDNSAATVGDIDGDGDVDIVVCDKITTAIESVTVSCRRVRVFENAGAPVSSFEETEIAIGVDATRVQIADLDGDGAMDVLCSYRYDYLTWSGSVRKFTWLRNVSNGGVFHFERSVLEVGGFAPFDTADVNGDGRLDIVSTLSGLSWLENQGDSPTSFTQHVLDPPTRSDWVTAADVDGDGDIDFVTSSDRYETVDWRENVGGEPPVFVRHPLLEDVGRSCDPRVVDFDLDGDGDIVSFYGGDFYGRVDGVVVLENLGGTTTTFAARYDEINSRRGESMVVGDVDGDGDPDVVTAGPLYFHENIETAPRILPIIDAGTRATSTPVSLDIANTYYWNVTAKNGAGESASPTWSFRTSIGLPEKPTAPSPAFGATNIPTTVSLSWQDCERADTYDVYLWKTTEEKPHTPTASGLPTPWYRPPAPLDRTGVYLWQVEARNAAGGVESDLWAFTAERRRPYVAIHSPGAGYNLTSEPTAHITASILSQDVASTTFTWRLEISSDTGRTWWELANGSNEVDNALIFSWDHRFTLDRYDYLLRLVATNQHGGACDMVDLTNPLHPPGVPVYLSPADNAVDAPPKSVLFDWASGGQTTNYDLYIAPEVDGFVDNYPIVTDLYPGRSGACADLDGDGGSEFIIRLDDGRLVDYAYRADPPATPPHGVEQGGILDFESYSLPAVVDFNQDDRPDLLILTADYPRDLCLLLNDGGDPTTFTSILIGRHSYAPDRMRVADFDGDGDMDLCGTVEESHLYWFENVGGTPPTFIRHYTSMGMYAEWHLPTPHDIDNDGDVDIVIPETRSPYLSVHFNDGATTPTFDSYWYMHNTDRLRKLVMCDLNGDGYMDMVGLTYNDNTLVWFDNQGRPNEFSYIIKTIATDVSGGASFDVGDFDGDGDIDIAAVSVSWRKPIWLENGGGPNPTFTRHDVRTELTEVNQIWFGDFDNDGRKDLIVMNDYSRNVYWLERGLRPGDWVRATSARPESYVQMRQSLGEGIVWYWKVLARNVKGTVEGPVWCFATTPIPAWWGAF